MSNPHKDSPYSPTKEAAKQRVRAEVASMQKSDDIVNVLKALWTELEALGDVAQAVSSTLDLDTVLNTIVERAVQLSGADAGAINELDKATGIFLPPHAAPGMEEMIKLPPPPVASRCRSPTSPRPALTVVT